MRIKGLDPEVVQHSDGLQRGQGTLRPVETPFSSTAQEDLKKFMGNGIKGEAYFGARKFEIFA